MRIVIGAAAPAMAVLAAALMLGACGGDSDSSRTTGAQATARPSAEVDHELVETLVLVEEARIHVAAATAPGSAAAEHRAHPLEELYPVLHEALEDDHAGLDGRLKAALTAFAKLKADADATAAATEVDGTLDAIDEALAPVDDRPAALTGSVAVELLEHGAHEYEEGVSAEGAITKVEELEDARAMLSRALELVDGIAGELGDERAEVDELAADLREVIDGGGDAKATTAAAPAEVEALAGGIAHELEEALGLEGGEDVDLAGEIDAVREGLADAQAAMDGGDREAADAALAAAYLEHFELVEGPLAEHDPELMERIEQGIATRLRDMAKGDATTAEFTAEAKRLEADLDTAGQLLAQDAGEAHEEEEEAETDEEAGS